MAQPDQLANNNSNLPAILYMLAGIFTLSIMDAVAKWLVTADYSVFQILAIRGWIITTVFIAYHSYRGTLKSLRTSRIKDHIFRALIGFLAPFCFFTAIGQMPLADAVVIFFAAPFIMSALSFFLLKEKVGAHRIGSMVIGFIGVMIVMEPGKNGIHPAAIYAIIGCVAYSIINIMTRWMSNSEPPHRFVFYFNLGTAIIGSAFLPFVWKSMPLFDLAILFALAAIALSGHLLITKAFSTAPVSVIAPFEYSGLLWSTLLGFFVWGDFPAEHIWLGAVIILTSGLYLLHRENKGKIKFINKLISRR